MTNKEFIEILQKIQEIINTTEENNACIYYNDACDGKALNEIEKLVDYALNKTKKEKEA